MGRQRHYWYDLKPALQKWCRWKRLLWVGVNHLAGHTARHQTYCLR